MFELLTPWVSYSQNLNIPSPAWEPDEHSPPLDHQLLRRVARDQGSAAEIREVASYAVRFRPWWTAVREAILNASPQDP